ncbi:unnamed protein product [Chrysodeixis includens]|uniref:Uncharacterized protein n=1 Tax=Chrysodeixis includens TaxID=689277 RepID=A0A9N8KUE0_CHRIL|nr:unnamed protein product [Chrysodeixis includens]
MLPSVAAKCFYRKLSRHSIEIKYLHTLCFGTPKILRHDFFIEGRELGRCVSTTAYLFDNPKSKSALAPEKPTSDGSNVQKVIKQSVTGDIIVKTESDANKVVTKVTIEKNKLPPKETPSPPGIFYSTLSLY